MDISRYGKEGLLFNSLRDRRPGREPIPYICDFSRCGLNARLKRSHLNLTPRPQIQGIGSLLGLFLAGVFEYRIELFLFW